MVNFVSRTPWLTADVSPGKEAKRTIIWQVRFNTCQSFQHFNMEE